MASPFLALEHQSGRGPSRFMPMPRWMGLDAGPGGGQRGADLQHVGAQGVLVAGLQVVGVVLHEGGGAVAVLAHGPS